RRRPAIGGRRRARRARGGGVFAQRVRLAEGESYTTIPADEPLCCGFFGGNSMPPERWRAKCSEAQRRNASLRFGLHRPCPGSSRRREWPGGDFADSSGRLVMSAGGAAGGAAAAAAAIARALKASGAIVR